MSLVIETTGLTRVFGNVKAVDGLDLRVEAGKFFGFLGPNGAGKSTTVRMLTTLLSITSGTAVVAGVDVGADPAGARTKIGVALQEAGLDERQKGRELLLLQARLFGMTADAAAARTQELLELVDLVDAADRLIKGYSGGMKRRLDLASALVHRPDVLFLDEPTTGLDPNQIRDVRRTIRELGRDKAVLLSTHILQEVEAVCDRIVFVNEGRVVFQGTVAELKATAKDDLDAAFARHTGQTPAGVGA